ncbi:hypothetical protein MKW94_030536 [Papaver nudicaule]|uniref:Glyoxalase/fosfomycin resistance/dioxygenase domain-containing protein n=1 Tax=Papaver nudicaule TaxID=74823 RepID=A0AA41VS36_PAPNU|nr:hypothetical protein [Papaver nudicaule]
MASGPKESPSNNPGLNSTPDEATKGYFMQQTMFRIKDPKISLDFYSRVLGMSLLKRLDFPEMKFSKVETATTDHNLLLKDTTNGNSDPRGFGMHLSNDSHDAIRRFISLFCYWHQIVGPSHDSIVRFLCIFLLISLGWLLCS